ncbi:hypothetical protein ACIGFK_18105 [Streptomyces sp. NPDC085524]|uniref:hypothetical protein n=1 Tax=Streptomyces sp. NPDC085524 TaxID=3365728 RepID=UPI0037D4578A
MGNGSVRVHNNALILGEGVQIHFIRTLRLPESGTHALPPGMGEFPLRRVEDHPDTVPPEWLAKGGVMLPVYLREAMWLRFGGTREPAALQVGVGKVCAVSGERWTGRLARDPQNYVTLPRQPWLDGINSGNGTVRQFVAVPLGLGATVEGQVTGEETTGGVQLQVFPLGPVALAHWRRSDQAKRAGRPRGGAGPQPPAGFAGRPGPPPMMPAPMMCGGAPGSARPGGSALPPAAPAMGLGVGGSMRQEVYRDDRPLSDWAEEPAGRVFVHLVPPPAWRHITGEDAPPSPADRAAYTRAGLPWFDYYDDSAADLAPADALGEVKPVGEWLGDDHAPWAAPHPGQVKQLGNAPRPGRPVQDGDW